MFTKKENGEHRAEVVQTNNYYPFGLQFNQGSSINKQSSNYLYNGKELQTDFSLDWYDYGARFYDATIGRFHTIDNYAEKYYDFNPYQYGANNPIYYVDVNGDSISVSNLMFQNGKLNVQGLYVLFNMMSDLQDITGLTLQVNSNGMLVSDGSSANGGSQKARNYLSGIMGAREIVKVNNDQSKDTQGGGMSVNINYRQIEDNIASARAAGINEKSYGFGMSFLHETLHTRTGTFVLNPNAKDVYRHPARGSANYFGIGSTVTKINEFRTELEYATRQQYRWQMNPRNGTITMQWKSS